jgi:hypothetical protein
MRTYSSSSMHRSHANGKEVQVKISFETENFERSSLYLHIPTDARHSALVIEQ